MSRANYDECPVCGGCGEGPFADENGECKFCEGFGLVTKRLNGD